MTETTYQEMYAGYLEAWEIGMVLRCLNEKGVQEQDRDEIIQDVAMLIRTDSGNRKGVSPSTRIFHLTKNCIREYRRRVARYRKHIEEIHSDAEWTRLEESLSVCDVTDSINIQHDVRHACSGLSSEHQSVCYLWADGLSRQQIADSLGYGWQKVARLQKEIRHHFIRLGLGTETVNTFAKGVARA